MKKNSLSDIKFADRKSLIINHCKQKNVLHLGATAAPKTELNIKNNSLLHSAISEISKKTIGMDFDQSMIDIAKKYGINNIYLGNVEKYEDYPKLNFDVIVAGEIFEHLNNPGLAVESIARISDKNTEIIVTVPNAYSIKSIFRSFLGYEFIHPDHVLFHSPATLVELFRRYGFKAHQKFSYVNGGTGLLFEIFKLLFKITPSLADGVGIIFKREEY